MRRDADVSKIYVSELRLEEVRQQFGAPDTGDLVAKGPHRIEPEGLVARSVRHDIRVRTLGVRKVVIH